MYKNGINVQTRSLISYRMVPATDEHPRDEESEVLPDDVDVEPLPLEEPDEVDEPLEQSDDEHEESVDFVRAISFSVKQNFFE
jgi:hypothetical protein